jgi:hypothetical protein
MILHFLKCELRISEFGNVENKLFNCPGIKWCPEGFGSTKMEKKTTSSNFVTLLKFLDMKTLGNVPISLFGIILA